MAITIEELELAKKIMFKRAMAEVRFDRLKAEFETASRERKQELNQLAGIEMATIEAFKEVLLEMPLGAKWRFETLQRMKKDLAY